MLSTFAQNQGLLESAGWFPGAATSWKWWGGLSKRDEIIISSVLVQQQRWSIVRSSLEQIRSSGHSTLQSMSRLSVQQMVRMLRGLNFYKTKAKRLLKIAKLSASGDLARMLRAESRDELLSLEGVGEETADSLLLFAGNQLVLPVSTYVRRVLERVLGRKSSPSDVRSMCHDSLPHDLYSYKLFYAGASTVGSAFCHMNSPDCANCILSRLCSFSCGIVDLRRETTGAPRKTSR
jgi:endonuclease-3 related protein